MSGERWTGGNWPRPASLHKCFPVPSCRSLPRACTAEHSPAQCRAGRRQREGSYPEAGGRLVVLSLSRPTRRKFLVSAALAGAGCLGIAGDGALHGARDLVLEHLTVRLSRLPMAFEGFSIVQLSDFHYDTFSRPIIESAVTLTNRLKRDLVVLTGDYVTQPLKHQDDWHAVRNAEPCAELLAGLTARMGTYAVLGNHDVNTDPGYVTAALESYGINVLDNRCVPIEQEGKRLWLAGLADVLGRKADLDRALCGIPLDEPTVLLVHEPDYADYVPKPRIDLQLSGHSHGGQIVLPLVGPPYLPQLARKYWRGMYKVGPVTLYTNCGLGTIWLPMRLNARPEITLLRLEVAN